MANLMPRHKTNFIPREPTPKEPPTPTTGGRTQEINKQNGTKTEKKTPTLQKKKKKNYA